MIVLKDLSIQTMISLSAAWVDPGDVHTLLESLPQTGAILVSVVKAHRGLLETQPSGADSATASALLALQKESAETDVRHDRFGRGVHGALTSFADLADDEEEAARYLALRDRIFPPERGLRVLQASYAEEAGEAELVEQRLTDADRALLKKLPFPGGKLDAAHKARIAAARKLGALESRRHALTVMAAGEETTTLGDARQARNAWIRAVRALLALIELDAPEEDARLRILGPLEEAERKAARRNSGAKAAPEAPAETSDRLDTKKAKPEPDSKAKTPPSGGALPNDAATDAPKAASVPKAASATP